jgi:hypothetical protein
VEALRVALGRSRVVVLVGPRQCGKTTLARELLPEDSVNYFDLEDPVSLARLNEPMVALGPLRGLVVIDEVQRRPDLFPVLRVLADRRENPARFLILGSASGDLLRQTSESLASRWSFTPAANASRWLTGSRRYRCKHLPTNRCSLSTGPDKYRSPIPLPQPEANHDRNHLRGRP